MVSEFFQHLINGISMGAIYALVALGYTMVYGILQFINFAHADIYMVGAFVAFFSSRYLNLGEHPHWIWFFVVLLISTFACALLGFIIEKLAYRPLRKSPKLNILITAIGVSLFLEYGGQILFGVDPKLFPPLLAESVLVTIGSINIMTLDVIILGISLVSMFALHWLVFKSKLGKAMRAVSQNSTVAAMLGIHIDRVISFTFIVGSALAGIAAVLVGMRYPKIEPMMGMLMGTKAFVAAVLGGIGSLTGAVIGGLIMGLSEEMVVGYSESTYRDALSFGILIIILIFKPTGLMGTRKVEKV